MARDYLKGRGLGEEVCREFRLGLALGGDRDRAQGAEKGFTPEELREAGLHARSAAATTSSAACSSRWPTRAAASSASRRGVCTRTTRSPRSTSTPLSRTLFHKGSVLYGLDKARAEIAREDRAVVVEGNTDVLALRQAGFGPVVACMGTALTAPQLTELGRLTKRLWLAFDGDAAGESATLRGMELAAQQGFDVKVVALPPGVDPADDPAGFDARLRAAEPYLVYRVQAEIARAEDRESAFRAVKTILDAAPDYAREERGLAHRERPARHDDPAACDRLLDRVCRPVGLAALARCRRPPRARRARRGDRPPGPAADPRRAQTPDHFDERAPPRDPRPPRRRHAARRRRDRPLRGARRRGRGRGDRPTRPARS